MAFSLFSMWIPLPSKGTGESSRGVSTVPCFFSGAASNRLRIYIGYVAREKRPLSIGGSPPEAFRFPGRPRPLAAVRRAWAVLVSRLSYHRGRALGKNVFGFFCLRWFRGFTPKDPKATLTRSVCVCPHFENVDETFALGYFLKSLVSAPCKSFLLKNKEPCSILYTV